MKMTNNEFEYWNSYSFYLLVFYGERAAQNYLEKRLYGHSFEKMGKGDYFKALVFKNYASLLKDETLLQKRILKACLTVTPQDADLWYTFYDLFPDTVSQEVKFRDILNSGYPDLRFFSKIELTEQDQSLIIQLVLLLLAMRKHEMVDPLLPHIENDTIRSVLQSLEAGA